MARAIPYIDTTVPVEKTIAELEMVLQVHHASHVMKEFESGHIKALAFKHAGMPFQLPVNVAPVYQHLVNIKTSAGSRYRYSVSQNIKQQWHEQAERCAWRNLLAWVKAQLALVEIGMVTVTEVFLPYMITDGQETLYQRMLTQGLKALPEGGKVA